MPQAGDFPTRDTIAGQHWGEHQVHDVEFRGAEAAGRGYDGNIVFVAQQEEITWFHRARKRSIWQPALIIERPITSSGPAGAVVDAIQALPHDIFGQLTGSFAVDRVSVQNGHGWTADGPGLQYGSSFFNDRNHRLQTRDVPSLPRASAGCPKC